MFKRISQIADFWIVFFLTLPSFVVLSINKYFTMHDDQHVARLFLLDNGLKQGYVYPRWVDTLTFGFGDPLFNFYPPLVYYIAEVFHAIGFSLITSVLMVFALGFILAAWGMYFFAREYVGRWGAVLSATLYTYISYHAVNAYVRGALAEFFTMAIIPFIFYYLTRLYKELRTRDAVLFGISLSLLILTHQLVALPFVFFLGFSLLHFFILSKNKKLFVKKSFLGGLLGLGLSAFFWLPAFIERNLTFLGQELGSYKLHYVYLQQFWYSQWGFGGSVAGLLDGMSFQIGKLYFILAAVSIILSFVYWLKKKMDLDLRFFHFYVLLTAFGIFMTTPYSAFVWDNFKLLWNLQFPWRFMAVNSVLISLLGGYFIFFVSKLFKRNEVVTLVLALALSVAVVFQYNKYMHPQQFTNATDKSLTTFDEIAWRQSLTVLHFVPKGVKAKQNEYGVYVLDIEKKNLPTKPYEVKLGAADVRILENKYQSKKFEVNSPSTFTFQLNTFHFAGWTALIDGKEVLISDNNPYKLINIIVPAGKHTLEFKFKNTPVRDLANVMSVIAFASTLLLLKLD